MALHIPTCTARLSLIIIDGDYIIYKRSQNKISIYLIFSVSTLQFTA